MKKGLLKSLFVAGAISLAAANSNDAKAQSNVSAFNDGAKTKTESAVITRLNSPVIKTADHDGYAQDASFDGNIGIFIAHDKNDPISGYRYAKGFANGFANREKTGDKPIYITATYDENTTENGSFVKIYINGGVWSYTAPNGTYFDKFTPQDAGKLLPLIMNDYVRENGYKNIIPQNVQPVVVASLN